MTFGSQRQSFVHLKEYMIRFSRSLHNTTSAFHHNRVHWAVLVPPVRLAPPLIPGAHPYKKNLGEGAETISCNFRTRIPIRVTVSVYLTRSIRRNLRLRSQNPSGVTVQSTTTGCRFVCYENDWINRMQIFASAQLT